MTEVTKDLPVSSNMPPVLPNNNDVVEGSVPMSPVSLMSQESTCGDGQEHEDLGNTELHCACIDFDCALVEKLLKSGASVAKTNKRERSCLHEMVLSYLSMNLVEQAGYYKKLKDIIVVLLKHELDVNMGDLKFQTPLHYVVRYNDQADIIMALASSGVRVNSLDRQGQSCLHLAVSHGNLTNLQALLEAGADPNITDTVGVTPIHIAAKGRHHEEVLRKLLQCGGRVGMTDKAHRTPLHVAAKAGRTDAVLILLEARADIMARDNSGQTPLHLAAGHDMTGKVCTTMMEWSNKVGMPFDVSAVDDVYRETPLHRAVRLRMTQNIQPLVDYGAKFQVQDVLGDSPIHKAATLQEIRAWKILMAAGHNYVCLVNNMGLTAFQIAAKAKNQIALSMMRQYGVGDF